MASQALLKPRGYVRGFVENPELFEEFCRRMASGRSLVDVCSDDDMPSSSSVSHWIAYTASQDQLARYASARELQADALFDELIDIADDSRNDYVWRLNKKTGVKELVADQEHINRTRLRIDTRKWIVSKLLPKKYGDINRTEITGKDGGAIELKSDAPEILELAATLRQAKRGTAPVTLEGQATRVEAPRARIRKAVEDVSDLI